MKHIIITGATGNLGRATVERLRAEGHYLIVTARPGSKAVPVGDNLEVYELDLSDEQAAQDFVHAVAAKHGTVDAAILLAGGYAGGGIEGTTGSQIHEMISLNFDTAYHVARPSFNQMIQQAAGGRIIFIGARPALRPQDGSKNVAYGLSKSMLFRLAEMMNAAGEDHGVVSSVIVPGTIDSPANRKDMPTADFSRWVKPGDIAEMIAILISDKAASLREPIIKMYGGRGDVRPAVQELRRS